MIKSMTFLFLSLALLSSTFAAEETPTEPAQDELSTLFDNPGNLTDREMYEAKKFDHQGFRERKKDEACQLNSVNCAADGANSTGLTGVLEENMGKAYVMIFGGLDFLGGGSGPQTKFKDKKTPAKNGKEAKTEKDSRNDYCMYGAMGYEGIMMLAQTSLNANVESETANIKDVQLRALTALKKNHQSRQKTALMGGIVYGTVSACYTGYAMAGGYTDPKLYMKGTGALLLTYMYKKKHDKHKAAAAAVESVIQSLPKIGDCNPYTEATCFCKEESSALNFPNEFEQVCVRKQSLTDLQPSNFGCGNVTNGQVSFDKNCKCKQTNTCFLAPVKPFNPKFSLGNNVFKTQQLGNEILTSTDFDPAKLAAFSTSSNSTAVALRKIAPKLPKASLTPEQQKIADEFSNEIPANAAAIIATAPNGKVPGQDNGSTSGLDKLPEATKKKLAEAIKANYNSGSGGSTTNAAAPDENFAMPSFGEKAVEDNSAEVLSFAEKAMANADVNNSPDTPLFDIISNRYRRSGWNKVESVEPKP